ncbi:unnamed protein product [Musa acuminata subsp. malaccensis]|uniref:(wild Malaysian banana) hypothetical protein n=1 Tax=Musa acuminata subsp. malaccensis TaxID=214687 RepID=A0A804JBI8_MUSAM|nr:unnamed protein product [Musa acuminata subsp. malaccensis]
MKFSRLIWHLIDRSSNSNRSGGKGRETHEPSRGDVTVDGTVHKTSFFLPFLSAHPITVPKRSGRTDGRTREAKPNDLESAILHSASYTYKYHGYDMIKTSMKLGKVLNKQGISSFAEKLVDLEELC